jgi:DNA-binding transcriptional regulator YiaG
VIPTTDADLDRAKWLYTAICNQTMPDLNDRAQAVRELEKITGKDFRDTSEFHNEVSAFLARKSRVAETIGTRIKRARRRAKMTQSDLAASLGVNRRTLIRWESNEVPPSPAALEWLNSKNGHQGEM